MRASVSNSSPPVPGRLAGCASCCSRSSSSRSDRWRKRIVSVNKPIKIVPPGDGKDKADTPQPADKGSLFERASGAFGFDNLAPARVPAKLPQGKAVRMPIPARRPAAPDDLHEPEPRPESRPESHADAVPAVAARAQPPVVIDADARPSRQRELGGRKVEFTGKPHAISRAHLRDQGMIDPELGSGGLVEEFRIVKRQVLASVEADGTAKSRRVLICSPHPGEGKTFCATNLAIALAGERQSEVVLVDADFGKPSIMATFGLDPAPGLMDALRDPAIKVEDLVLGTDIPGLWILPAGERSGSDAEYLASERTWEVLNRLTRGAHDRIVIFDSPPALAASPAAELAKHCGQALLVARADSTARAALEDAVDLLSGCPDIRLLLNDATFSPSGRKFGKYYGYGESAS
ncbi:MAG: capsular biosynthesis protein [Alphaproteobacteria bacterium]|nr:capsular biosynthesis protein [Alphaproteobacteria bacterium]